MNNTFLVYIVPPPKQLKKSITLNLNSFGTFCSFIYRLVSKNTEC